MSGSGNDPAADLLASLRANSGKISPAVLPSSSTFVSSEPTPSSPQSADPLSRRHFAQPRSSHDKMSRQSTPAAQAGPDLLGLLKFGQPAASSFSPQTTTTPPTANPPPTGTTQARPEQQQQARPGAATIHGRGVSASDLVSSLAGGKLASPSPAPSPRERNASPSTASAHQNSLLKLLNQTASGSRLAFDSSSRQESHTPTRPQATPIFSPGGREGSNNGISPKASHSPMQFFGSKEGTPAASFDTGVHPFEFRSTAPASSASKPHLASNGGAAPIKQKSPSPSPLGAHPPAHSQSAGQGNLSQKSAMGNPLSLPAVTVPEALSEVAGEVDQEVTEKLAKLSTSHDVIKQEPQDEEQVELDDIQAHVQEAATILSKELQKEENKDALKEVLPTPTAEAVKEMINDVAAESAAPMSEAGAKSREIKVYQFPMRPFVSIDFNQKEAPSVGLRAQSDLPVARFKKDFDQSDRVLGTATTDFIVYSMPKSSGGVRVIEQTSGNSNMVFPGTNDRVFNVSVAVGSGSSEHMNQNVIATGLSGTVYFATISKPGVQMSQEEMQTSSLQFPPSQAGSEPTSGGQLKTRAKKSSRHPEYFAVGRGKSIQIVFPEHARQSEYTSEGVVDTEQYFRTRSLKVTPGKAGKDFAFSEDDTVITTLDKAGKLRLWDIRELVDEANATASRLAPIEIKTPLLTYSTVSSSDKSWPTSVLFVDKARPYLKGSALRYIIVGMKQNHTLQLWDLCLGKPVQEVNFSHENETDPICSVCYHANSGVLVVGHPTRNSIYFLHLSAPKYNLSQMSQAKLAQGVASKDPKMPKADATAIMSGMREYSLADKGQLRSVELTQASGDTVRDENDDEPPLFELVVMHSKGVMCLAVKKEDLGWSAESKVLHPVNAEQEGIIVVKDLKEISSTQGSEPSQSSNGELQPSTSPAKGLSPKTSKDPLRSEPADVATPSREPEKKKKDKKGGSDSASKTPVTAASDSYASAAHKGLSAKSEAKADAKIETKAATKVESSRPHVTKHASLDAPESLTGDAEPLSKGPVSTGDSVSVGISADLLDKEIKRIEQGVSSEFRKVLGKELDSLYKHIAEEKRVQDAAGAAKQDAILRLVAKVLDENVETSLSNIVQKSIHEQVVPAVSSTTSSALNKQLSSLISSTMRDVVPTILKQSTAETVHRALQSPELVEAVSVHVSKALTGHIEREMTSVMNKTITPTFQHLALSISQKITGETERRLSDHLEHFEQVHRSDTAKIDQLTSLVGGLSDMVNTMATAQSQFQEEILRLQRKAAQDPHGHSPTPSESASMVVSPEQEELDSIAAVLNEGRYEDATIMWLQSKQQAALFDNLLCRVDPSYLASSAALIVLSVGAAVTATLETHTAERLAWLEVVLNQTSASEPETRDLGGKIFDVLIARLESEYMRTAEANPADPILRKISTLARITKELRKTFPG